MPIRRGRRNIPIVGWIIIIIPLNRCPGVAHSPFIRGSDRVIMMTTLYPGANARIPWKGHGGGSVLQKHIQRSVRRVHRIFFRRPLPTKLSLFLHSTMGWEQRLDELLCFLRDRGYSFAGPGEFLTAVGNTCFLSFDDNYRSWLGTLSILDKYQVEATFYVNSWPFRDRVSETEARHYIEKRFAPAAASEQETTLSIAELREIAAAGHTIGCHTHTHPVLTALQEDKAHAERFKSARRNSRLF